MGDRLAAAAVVVSRAARAQSATSAADAVLLLLLAAVAGAVVAHLLAVAVFPSLMCAKTPLRPVMMKTMHNCKHKLVRSSDFLS